MRLRVGVLAFAAFSVALLVAPEADAQRRRRRDDGPATGQLLVQVQQEGAEILVDEAPVGISPMEALELPPGSHTLRVRLPGYSEYTEVVTITRGRTEEVPVELFPISQILSLTTVPEGARVFVDGNFMGETPLELELVEGDHSLRLTLRGYEESIRQVSARAGTRDSLELALVSLPDDVLAAAAAADQPAEWYEEPWPWLAIGGGALAIAAIVVIVVIATSTGGERVDDICAQVMGGCDTIFEPF